MSDPTDARAELTVEAQATCECGQPIGRYWRYCPACARPQTWDDPPSDTTCPCPRCQWSISRLHGYCPWCGEHVFRYGVSSHRPLDLAPGFRKDAPCDWDCGGGVQYPMAHCPWCGRDQGWGDDDFEGPCADCSRGVDDWMDTCPWCGGDPTGRGLIQPALREVDQLLSVSRVRGWGFRVLLRPGVSGVDPAYPKIVEIDRSYAVGKPPNLVPWTRLVGLITHELGHSFLYHHGDWAREERFRRAFGNVDEPYNVPDDVPVDFHHRRVAPMPADHVTPYARLHPQEDFAETFRFFVTREARLDELFAELEDKGKTPRLFEKFLTLHDYLRRLVS